jgi:hypothetical protein
VLVVKFVDDRVGRVRGRVQLARHLDQRGLDRR